MTPRQRLLAVLALGAPAVAHAQDATRLRVDVTALAGYSNNPFSEAGDDVASPFVALDVVPALTVASERSTFRISGLAHVQQYFRRYSTSDSYRVSLDYHGQPAERLTTFASVDLSSAILGADEGVDLSGGTDLGGGDPTGGGGTTGGTTNGGTGGVVPGGTIGPLFSDIGLFGSRDRRRSVYVTGGGSYAVSDRDTVTASAFGEIARYRVFGDRSNYDAFGGSVGYSRRVSAYFNAGLRGSASQYDYSGVRGDTTTYSIEATGSGRVNAHWNVEGALGVTFVDTSEPGSGTLTSLSGSISLCSQGQRSTLCFNGSRQARATGFNGAQYVTTAGANWSYQLDERSHVSLDASYLQEGGVSQFANGSNKYLRLGAGYNRQLRQRLRGVVSARYRKVFGGVFDRADDFGGQIGLTYTFGDAR